MAMKRYWKLSPTISAKSVGVGAVLQRLYCYPGDAFCLRGRHFRSSSHTPKTRYLFCNPSTLLRCNLAVVIRCVQSGEAA